MEEDKSYIDRIREMEDLLEEKDIKIETLEKEIARELRMRQQSENNNEILKNTIRALTSVLTDLE